MARGRGRGHGHLRVILGLDPNLPCPSLDWKDREQQNRTTRPILYLFQIETTVRLSNRAASDWVMLIGLFRHSCEPREGQECRVLSCSRRGPVVASRLGRRLFEVELRHHESRDRDLCSQDGRQKLPFRGRQLSVGFHIDSRQLLDLAVDLCQEVLGWHLMNCGIRSGPKVRSGLSKAFYQISAATDLGAGISTFRTEAWLIFGVRT